MDEDEDTEQSTPEQGSTAADEPPESPPEEAEESTEGDDQPAEESPEPETPPSADEAAAESEQPPAEEEAAAGAEGADDTATDEAAGSVGSPVGENLVERASQYDEELSAEVGALVERAFELKDESDRLRGRIDELETEREELEEEREDLKQRLVRKQADFKNYKERAKKKQDQIRDRATEDLVERLLPVRDNLTRALEQDANADIRDGVEATLRDFDRVLEDENVEEIVPDEGDEVDPQRHEVMVRVDSELPEGDIVDVYRPGYEMADKVIQTAQVTVSNGADHEPDTEEAVALGGEVEADDTEASAEEASETAAADDEAESVEETDATEEEEEATAGDNRH